MTQKKKALTPIEQKPPETAGATAERIDAKPLMDKIDAALAKKKKKAQKRIYWTCNNRFVAGSGGVCDCTDKFRSTYRRTTSRAGLEKPIRCNAKGEKIRG